jgi:hypothetical protein
MEQSIEESVQEAREALLVAQSKLRSVVAAQSFTGLPFRPTQAA